MDSELRASYGSLVAPSLDFVADVLRKRPYRRLVKDLGRRFQIKEDTDTNYMVCFFFYVRERRKGRGWLRKVLGADVKWAWAVRLSMVGPYAVITREGIPGEPTPLVEASSPDLSSSERELVDLVQAHGLTVVSRQRLEQSVAMKLNYTEAEEVRLFQALFEDHILPWRTYDVDRFGVPGFPIPDDSRGDSGGFR